MILVGMSQGGRIALHFALAHPEAVAGLVLQGAPLDGFAPGPAPEEAIPLADYAALVRAGRLEEMKARWAAHPLMAEGGGLLAGYEARDLIAGENPMPAISHRLGEIAAPTLVVTGDEDSSWRQMVSDFLARGLPNARRARIAGGHLCNLSHPEAFNSRIASFAEEVAG